MEREEPKDKDKCTCNIIVKFKKMYFKTKRIPAVDIDDIRENIRRKMWKENRTKGNDSDNRMVTITQKGEEEINNKVRLGKN
jgi:hypothetical protein